jgi:hypothetical protein
MGTRKLPRVAGIAGIRKKKDHDDSVLREDLVVSARLHEIALRSQQLKADGHRVQAANEEEEANAAHIKQCDPLVIFRQQPRLNAVCGVQVIRAWRWYREFFHEVLLAHLEWGYHPTLCGH